MMDPAVKKLSDSYFLTFTSPAGKAVLANLRAAADAPVDYSRPRDGMAMALEAAFRDGQRAQLASIERMVKMSKSGVSPDVEAETDA